MVGVWWRDKKAGTRVVGCFRLEMGEGWGIYPSRLTAPRRRRGGNLGGTISQSDAPHQPISPHIDEDALEGLYFAFSLILRCLPYFSEKTRPRGSYELLEAFLPSCGERIPHSNTHPILQHPSPTLRHPTPAHLTPHRRGCPRRALFRVLGNPKVFALLLRKNAS